MPTKATLVFVQRLADGSAKGASSILAAGLLVLRILDAVRRSESSESWGLAEARKLIVALQAPAARASLLRIADALADPGSLDRDAIAEALLEYGRALEDVCEWAAAIVVYRTSLRWMRQRGSSGASHVYHRMGHASLYLETPVRARAMFRRALRSAVRARDRDAALAARIGYVKVIVRRGDIGRARRLIHRHLAHAKRHGFRISEGKAALVAGEMDAFDGQFNAMLSRLEAQLPRCVDIRDQYRMRSDIGYALCRLGRLEEARRMYDQVIEETPELFIKWCAYINLADIASLANDTRRFRECETLLSAERLPPHFALAVQETLGEASLRLGDHGRARTCFEAARAIAAEHAMNQCVFALDAKLAAIAKGRSNAAPVARGDVTNAKVRLVPKS